MTDILTLTMNPALDIATSTDTVVHAHKLRCQPASYHPGGGGINVARVLHRLGSDCLALFPAGGVTGQLLRQLLGNEQVPSQCVDIAGETRESFSVVEATSGREFRFVLPGPYLQPADWHACLAQVRTLCNGAEAPRYVVASGSLPPGVPTDFYAQLASAIREVAPEQVRLVVDTSGPALAAALAAGVYLVKPSLRELRDLTGQPLTTEPEWVEAAQQLVRGGKAELVAVSLGENGALLVSKDQVLRAQGLPMPVASSIGAGDSFVAGLVWGLSRGENLEQAFRYGMSAGAAALLRPGTALCQPEDVERLHRDVVVRWQRD